MHSNLEALNQFEKEIETIAHDKLVCLGDIVGYGADPNPCEEEYIRFADGLVNGSLGQPRHGNPDPAFMIYDSEEKTAEVRRFEYDLNSAQSKIRDNSLPPYLAEGR